jgi:rSAM/selenodomain-associated transferase 1
MSAWLGSDRTYHPQEGADLGERMERAFRAIFAATVERAVLIGSDLPDLPAGILHEAMDALKQHDAVIGPAQDGGYYLIGFRKSGFLPEIFRGIIWSRPDVFDRTRQIFRRANTMVHLLPPWQDVDTIEDLRDLMRRNVCTAFAGCRTMRYLETIRDRLSVTEGHHGEV